MNGKVAAMAAMGVAVTIGSPAWAGYTILQGGSAPTYTTTLNFDEPGGPTGLVNPDDWLVSHGISDLQAGDGLPQVDNWDIEHGAGWDGNSFYGNFGVFITFANDLDALSLEIWDPAGPPTPLGGGLGVFLFNDGVEVGSVFVTPAWGGVGDSWFDITSDGGDVFDEVRFLGFGFPNTTYADNLSWNVVPTPDCPSDINSDGVVNVLDLIELLLCFGEAADPPCDTGQDVDGNGTINVLDLIELLLAFGTACP